MSFKAEGWTERVRDIGYLTGVATSPTLISVARTQPAVPVPIPPMVQTGPGFPYENHVCCGIFFGTYLFSGTLPSNVGGSMLAGGSYYIGTAYQPYLLGIDATGPASPTFFLPDDVIEARRWTVGPAVVTDVSVPTPGGGLATGGTRTRTGFNDLTPNGAGTLQLIAPMRITTKVGLLGIIGEDSRTAAFTTLTLTFVPEPGPAALFGAASVGFAALGWQRRRERS